MSENYNHPSHYNFGTIEPITVIQDWELDFCLGNVVKYIARAGKKDGESTLKDLKKARNYLDFEISALEKTTEVVKNDKDRECCVTKSVTMESSYYGSTKSDEQLG